MIVLYTEGDMFVLYTEGDMFVLTLRVICLYLH